MSEPLVHLEGGELRIREGSPREVDYQLLSWGELGSTPEGWESFERGAFADTDPSSVVLTLDHEDPAVGRGLAIEERESGPFMTFRVAETARGDELLELVKGGVYRHASVAFQPVPGGTRLSKASDGRKLNVRTKVNLRAVGATWKPVFSSAQALEVRSMEAVTDPQTIQPAPVAPPVVQAAPMPDLDLIMGRLAELETRSRQDLTALPPAGSNEPVVRMADWASAAIRQLAGDSLPALELRALAEIVTGTNMGVVPDAYKSELIGPIEASRPFLESSSQITAPNAGTRIIVPRIVTRPTVGVQAAEKDEVTSTNTAIDTVDFPMVTVAGGGDISVQLLKRSSPEYLDLYVRLLGEDYAAKTDELGVKDLIAAGIQDGGDLDPESPSFGAAWSNSIAATKRTPNRIWMSGAAYAAFVDAKAPAGGGGNALYPTLAFMGGISGNSGSGPSPMALQPVIVPALDKLKATTPTTPAIIIGPSSGFAWAEDGTYTLQADNPGQAGRDVALVGMLWFASLYPDAFTGYDLAA